MNYSIAVYPKHISALSSEAKAERSWDRYIEDAAEQGFNEVFLSLHIPECTIDSQIELLEAVAKKAASLGMSLTADVGGDQIRELLSNDDYRRRICQAKVDLIRLDYGYTMDQVREMWSRWGIKGFVLNASMYDEAEIRSMCEAFRSIDEKIDIRACHNYYPRPETGLSYDLFLSQNDIFYRLGIPVYSFIPDEERPRGPVHEGLTTVECHRHMDIAQVVRQLAASPANTGFIAADGDLSSKKLGLIRKIAEEQKKAGPIMELSFFAYEDTPDEEIELICGQTHRIRYDSNDLVLRSRSSREMAEYASKVEPRPARPRPAGTVTVDNTFYSRYSGEVQIAISDLAADHRINCAGRISKEDMWKLSHYRYGVEYRFRSMGKICKKSSDDR